MITVKGDKNPLFILNTAHTTYAMKVLDTGHIEHLYYGRKIHMDDADGLTEQHEFAPGTTSVYSPENGNFSLEDMRLEMSSYGKGDLSSARCSRHKGSTADSIPRRQALWGLSCDSVLPGE